MLTKEEFIATFKNAKVKFTYYYKHRFQYTGKHKNYKIAAYYGTQAEDIYRYEVTTKPIPLIGGCWDYIKITDDKNEVIYEEDNC